MGGVGLDTPYLTFALTVSFLLVFPIRHDGPFYVILSRPWPYTTVTTLAQGRKTLTNTFTCPVLLFETPAVCVSVFHTADFVLEAWYFLTAGLVIFVALPLVRDPLFLLASTVFFFYPATN